MLIALLAAVALITAFIAYRTVSGAADKLAVAGTFGQFKAFLLSTNYLAAYEMMSSDFKKTHSKKPHKY